MTAVMVQGTSSGAGKSLVATGLCRLAARAGVRVAPFKGQNMSNHARVVDGGEIGTAQWLQALAAGVTPDVRMNPVLVKPESDMSSQVVVLGRVDPSVTAVAWPDRAPMLWPAVESSLRSLLDEYDLVVLEGAGSPAEINLAACDIANLRCAAAADASVLLVADVDRGGAFAHLYGTWALLAEPDRARLRGFVLNKFRGDPALLSPGPAVLEGRTGVPTIGVVPMLAHGLPEEDGVFSPGARRDGRPVVAIVRYPRASNLDEFTAVEQVADVVWATSPAELTGATLVVLPGSKSVADDLAWLRSSGLAEAVRDSAAPVLGICGGLQMLGRRIDGAEGLGLLPVETTYEAEKLTRRTTLRFEALPPPWSGLSGLTVDGYEIRNGRHEQVALCGDVLGVSVHGLFESPDVVEALIGARPAADLDATFDLLADALAEHLDRDVLDPLLGL